MLTEWSPLDPFTCDDYDTPTLKKQRDALNQEINEILAERQRIDTAMAELENTPVENLSVEQINAGRTAKEDRFRLLQRELRLRNEQLPNYCRADNQAASAAWDKHEAKIPDIKAGIIKDLEKMGYLPFEENSRLPGQWTPEMLSRHPKMVAAQERSKHLNANATNYSGVHLNRERVEKLTASLTSARNQLVT